MAKRNLVFIENDTPVTTSLIIANGTKNQHESIIRLINEHTAHFKRWGQIYFSDLKSGNPKGGRPTRVAILNEQQATFLVTLLRNTDVVVEFKCELVDRFYKMREKLADMRSSGELERLKIRQAGKVERKGLTDAIKPFADREHNLPQGLYYAIPTKFIQETLCGIPKGGRNDATGEQLSLLSLLESTARDIFQSADKKGDDYDTALQKVRNTALYLQGGKVGRISFDERIACS